MNEYQKEIYALKNKSKEGIQHYGFIISMDGNASIRQWHKPKVMGHVFMTEDEANREADKMMQSFEQAENLPPIEQPEDRISRLEDQVKALEASLK